MNRDYTFMWWRDGFNKGAQHNTAPGTGGGRQAGDKGALRDYGGAHTLWQLLGCGQHKFFLFSGALSAAMY